MNSKPRIQIKVKSPSSQNQMTINEKYSLDDFNMSSSGSSSEDESSPYTNMENNDREAWRALTSKETTSQVYQHDGNDGDERMWKYKLQLIFPWIRVFHEVKTNPFLCDELDDKSHSSKQYNNNHVRQSQQLQDYRTITSPSTSSGYFKSHYNRKLYRGIFNDSIHESLLPRQFKQP
jgi:hypothetical protein